MPNTPPTYTGDELLELVPGTVPTGAVTPAGVVDAVSLTAYRIGGTWVPFRALHGRPTPAVPLAFG